MFQSAGCATEGGTGLHTAHIHNRRILLFFVVLALALGLLGSALALTDAGSIAFTMSVDPSSLKEPGEVTVTLNIENLSEEDIQGPLTLYDADNKLLNAAFDGGALALLKAGETQTWTGKWRVSQQHLDAGKIAFNLRLNTVDQTGAITQVSLEAFANILFVGEKVALEVEREITPELVRPGGTVVVSYTLSNTGTVKLTDIRVRENNLISTAAQTVASLDPGATANLKFTKKVGNQGVESSAVIEYKQEGKKTTEKETVSLVAIPLARPGFSAVLSADSTSITIGEKVTLTLLLKNVGNISYSNIVITDPKLGEVFSDVSLPAGEERTLTKEITLMSPTSFKFSIALEDNSGVKQTETTNEVKVSAYEAGQVMRLNVQAQADRDAVEKLPGLVRFEILVTNDSNYAAKPVNVYAGETNNRIASHEELKPGESISFPRDFEISQAGRFGFSVRTVDALGVQQSFKSNEVTIAFAPPTAAPTAEAVPTIAPVVTYSPVPLQDTESTMGKASSALFIVTIALGLLFAASFLLFLASSAARARARRQSESAYDHLDVGAKRDYSDPSTYQGRDAEFPEEPAVEAVEEPRRELPHEKYLRDEEAPANDSEATPDSETAGYRLERSQEEPDSPENAEQRSRRAAKYHKPKDDEA